MPYVPTSPEGTADSAVHSLATQAENYRRAIVHGVPHDIKEARSILSQARLLVAALEKRDGVNNSTAGICYACGRIQGNAK